MMPTHSISAGLDYVWVGPAHAFYVSNDEWNMYLQLTMKSKKACHMVAQNPEWIIAALESSHAVAHAIKIAPHLPWKTIVVTVSGRGDKDLFIHGRDEEKFQFLSTIMGNSKTITEQCQKNPQEKIDEASWCTSLSDTRYCNIWVDCAYSPGGGHWFSRSTNPFSDPMADGPTFMHANSVAVKIKQQCKIVLILCEDSNKTNIPLLLMGYYNSIFRKGFVNFANKQNFPDVLE